MRGKESVKARERRPIQRRLLFHLYIYKEHTEAKTLLPERERDGVHLYFYPDCQ